MVLLELPTASELRETHIRHAWRRSPSWLGEVDYSAWRLRTQSPNRAPRVEAEKRNRIEAAIREDEEEEGGIGSLKAGRFTCVVKFGGSSLASAERIREIADLILSFPEENPVIVLSAMGKTTNNLLLAGEMAVTCGVSNASELMN